MGRYQLDPLLLLEGPKSHWALIAKESWITWKTLTFSSRLLLENPFGCCRGLAIPTSAAKRTSVYSWEHSKESPGRSRRPRTLLAKVLLLLRVQTSLQVVKERAQYKAQSQPANPCEVHASIFGATVFVSS